MVHDKVCFGIGVTIPFTNKRFELWYCPTGYTIKPHRHPNAKIRLTALWGSATFVRIKDGIKKSFKFDGVRTMFKTFNIGAADWHWSEKIESSIIFFNNETWTTKPTTASQDFELMPQDLKDKYYA